MTRVLLLTGMILSLMAGCSGSKTADNSAELQRLQAAPVKAQLAGEEIALATFLWRNFMPTSDPEATHPLLATLTLQTTDQQGFPAGVTVEKVWFINSEEVWSTSELEMFPLMEGSPHLTVKLRNGPEWDTGLFIDVVLELNDAAGETALLKAAAQEIERVE